MNRNIIIAIVVVVLLGLGGFFVLNKKSNNTINDGTMGQQQANGGPKAQGPQSLKDLFTAGTSQKCTFTLPDSKESMGTVYVAGGKVRGDFTVMLSGKDMTTHMIGDGTTSYIWTDGQSTGFKMAFDPTTEVNEQKSPAQSQGMDVNAKMNYDCSSWRADQSVFTVPSEVKFTEMNVPKMGTSVKGQEGTDMKVQQCAACDNAPAEAQAQCKAALGCN